jgi:hypothetical protein
MEWNRLVSSGKDLSGKDFATTLNKFAQTFTYVKRDEFAQKRGRRNY